MKLNKKAQALDVLQATVLGVVTTVAILGVGYAVVGGLRDSQGYTGNASVDSQAATSMNSGFTLLDTIKNNMGLVITIIVFSVVLAGIVSFGALRRE